MSHVGKCPVQHEQHHAVVFRHAAGLCAVLLRGHTGQHCHAKLLCYGKADGPRGRAYRQCVRHHHPVQRIQPDFLAVFAAEHGLHRLNET